MFRKKTQRNSKMSGALRVLPNEMIVKIVSYLDYPALAQLGQTNRVLHDIVEHTPTQCDVTQTSPDGQKEKRKGSYAEVRDILNRRHHYQREVDVVENDPLYPIYSLYVRYSSMFNETINTLLFILAADTFMNQMDPLTDSGAIQVRRLAGSFAALGFGISLYFNRKDFLEADQLRQTLNEMPDPLSPNARP